MFDLQFEKIHSYLFPRSYDELTGLPKPGQGVPDYPILNSANPRAGIHIARETIFTSGSLAFICYAKNLLSAVDPTKAEGVKVCLKITAGIRKGRGSYGSPKVRGETVSFECTLQDMVGIWRVLRGVAKHYSLYLPLPGQQPKSFDLTHQPNASDCYFAEISEGSTAIRVPFDEGAAFAFQAVIVAVSRILYPHLDDALVLSMLDGVREVPAAPTHSTDLPDEAASESSGYAPDLRSEGDDDIRPGIRKAIYAICLQSWPAKRKDVAQYIQRNAGQRSAQRIVDAANSGDFTELDQLAEWLDSHD